MMEFMSVVESLDLGCGTESLVLCLTFLARCNRVKINPTPSKTPSYLLGRVLASGRQRESPKSQK